MPPTPILNPSPKQRFMQSGTRVSDHRNMVSSDTFERSADAALLQYAGVLANATNPNEAMVNGLKLQGAQEFLQTFRLLAETFRAPTATVSDNLNAKA